MADYLGFHGDKTRRLENRTGVTTVDEFFRKLAIMVYHQWDTN